MIGHPGLIWMQSQYQYTPRWPFGQGGDIKTLSYPVDGSQATLLPGTLVTVTAAGTIVQASSLVGIAGVVLYDPSHFSPDVQYTPRDMVPILRRGSCFVNFITAFPPFANPRPLAVANVYLTGASQGWFSTDVQATPVPQAVFSIAAKDYYQTADGSPAMDIPFPVPPIPLGVTNTTFGAGVAIVEVNF